MTAELAIVPNTQQQDLTAIERVVVAGDLSKLTPDERWNYYKGVCQSVGLNPFTQPFLYITLSGKLVLYATKGAADQLRDNHHISISQPKIDLSDGLCIVTVTATDKTGRTDSDLGIVPCENLRGDAKANAILKAVTKAKRRVTLSMCGLGMLDESEVETVPNARPVDFPTVPAAIAAPTTVINDAPTTNPHAADAETRARFEANWAKGIERAARCGVEPDEMPDADATKGALNAAQRELMEAITAREALNKEFTEKHRQASILGYDGAKVDPAKQSDVDLHENIAMFDRIIAGAPSDDEEPDEAPF